MIIYYFDYILSIIILLAIILLLWYYKKNKNKKIFYSILDTPHPDILINDMINAFYYANMNGKNIKICLSNAINIAFDKHIKMKSIFNSSLIKFLIKSEYNYFIFFITKEGILEMIYFDNTVINYDENNKNTLLTIEQPTESNLFFIKQNEITIKNNTAQKTIHIIKEILKNNT
jgi:hypothetical protein